MSKYTLTLFPGDGIGPEITSSLKRIFKALSLDITYEEYPLGINALNEFNELIPKEATESLKRNKVAIKAPVTTPIGEGFKSVNVSLRQMFDLYANIRPAKSMPNTLSRYSDIDIITVRENTEDLYTGSEREIDGGYIADKIITKKNSERIIRYAFEYAVKFNRKKLTCIHKANIIKKADGLFLSIFNEIKKEYPTIIANDLIVDNASMQLVLNPNNFDMIVCPNLYGDILSDLIAGLIGGLGLAPSANIGSDIAIFEAVHGSAPDIKGLNQANPLALILSGAMYLDYIGENVKAERLRLAINKTLENKINLTKDLGGNGSTDSFTEEIIKNL